jgi:hypothetical protein
VPLSKLHTPTRTHTPPHTSQPTRPGPHSPLPHSLVRHWGGRDQAQRPTARTKAAAPCALAATARAAPRCATPLAWHLQQALLYTRIVPSQVELQEQQRGTARQRSPPWVGGKGPPESSLFLLEPRSRMVHVHVWAAPHTSAALAPPTGAGEHKWAGAPARRSGPLPVGGRVPVCSQFSVKTNKNTTANSELQVRFWPKRRPWLKPSQCP